MNFNALLLEFLKTNGPLSLLGFGTFFLKNSTAYVDSNGQNIVPPGKEIGFQTEDTKDSEQFLNFLGSKKDISVSAAETEIKKQVDFWNSTLEKEGILMVENIGTFTLSESNIHLTGNRLEKISPDFYGLEEINLSQIKKAKTSKNLEKSENAYHFKPSIWWIAPLIAGILAITYFGITQPEKIFGKRSFKNLEQKKPEIKVEKPVIISDSLRLNNLKSDSLKADSLQKTALPTNNIK